jgi:hypothetical protein
VISQQLVARIKRGSEYWGQTPPSQWFDVSIDDDDFYRIRGNSNRYRMRDVVLGARLKDGSVVDLTTGKVSRG